MSPAWLYFNGIRAGLTRAEIEHLPLGAMLDHIAVYQISDCGARARTPAVSADVFDF